MRLFNRIGLCFAFLLVATGSYVWAANFNPMSDTGQTSCFNLSNEEIPCPADGDSLSGQDGQYPGLTPSYTSSTINDEGVVIDNNTGLMWQQGVADVNGDNAISSDTYPTGDKMTWEESNNYCESLVFAGYDDWSLPEIMALFSILTYQRTDNGLYIYLDPDYFQNYTYRSWSATSSAKDTGYAWYGILSFSFDGGLASKSSTYYVRCVRYLK